ncbi:hypothetical protein IHE31_01225 (plasmid) [Mycetohabitans rhizoxinica]
MLFTLAIVLMEIGMQNERAPCKLAAKVAWSLVKNLLTMAPVVGTRLRRGTGPYMLAEFYRRAAAVTSQTILLSTVGSLVSLSLYWMRAPGG